LYFSPYNLLFPARVLTNVIFPNKIKEENEIMRLTGFAEDSNDFISSRVYLWISR